MTVYFVQTFHRKAGAAIHRSLVERFACCRIEKQTHLIASDKSANGIANELIKTIGAPRLVDGLISPSFDWTLLVTALAGTWAGTLEPAAAKWADRYLSPAARAPSRPSLYVAYWMSTDIARRDRPDGFFRAGFRDWIYPGFNTYLLRARAGAEDLHAGIRNKWRGARRGPNAREMVFIAELGDTFAAYLADGLREWLEEKVGSDRLSAASTRKRCP